MTTRPTRWWRPKTLLPTADPEAIRDILADLAEVVAVVSTPDGFAAATGGVATLGGPAPEEALPLAALLPPLTPGQLGDPAFAKAHRVRYPYMAGAMANGIASTDLVIALGRSGLLGSFGAAGLSLERVDAAITAVQSALGDKSYCFNLIHSPNDPALEMALAELYVRRGVRTVEASAYLDLTPAIVRYRCAGLRSTPEGVVATHRVIAKVSRTELATRFLSPAPRRILDALLAASQVTPEQAALAERVPMCDDLTAEADSGGHTDNRPAVTLLPTLVALRDRLQRQFNFPHMVRVGLGGGISTPQSVAAAFGMGAGYVVTGSVNQACVESGSSDAVRKMLAEADQADVTMAPAADMFEMGVKVQVLKRGTMFAMRGAKLYELYRQNKSWESVPEADRAAVEKTILRRPFDDVWEETRAFFLKRDPGQVPRAEADPRHKMALVFRWYLGLSSRWANAGDPARQLDYQVWCGPAMGAFNEWARGSDLESPANRTVVAVADNLMFGACLQARRESLRQQGVVLPPDCWPVGPLPTGEIQRRLS